EKHSAAIQIISEDLDQRDMDFLYDIADALVLPTRGEGFNRPAAEGMGRGVPIILTRHSGHLEFCNDNNACLIDCSYELARSGFDIPNSYWARADVDQLVVAMKAAYHAGRPPSGV